MKEKNNTKTLISISPVKGSIVISVVYLKKVEEFVLNSFERLDKDHSGIRIEYLQSKTTTTNPTIADATVLVTWNAAWDKRMVQLPDIASLIKADLIANGLNEDDILV